MKFFQEAAMAKDAAIKDESALDLFACPNPGCHLFNRFAAGNLSVTERMGKDKSIRRLYCDHCHQRFSERAGSLMQYTKLKQADVVRVIKCLTHGCSIEATADICEVDPRSVERLLDRGGKRSEDFHQLQLDRLAALDKPPEVVELDEMHAKVSRPPKDKIAGKKGGALPLGAGRGLNAMGSGAVLRAATGFMWRLNPLRGLRW
jgi:transposase-like protein